MSLIHSLRATLTADPLLASRTYFKLISKARVLMSVMKDPVILPVSRVVIDRSTIRTHLLSNEKDPFSGVP